ncbi:uncharacterized protein LOC126844909 [Adelges cooleyi]|uniref:uncharacterized protein LOC126844909 n=1 Tax=Adelges cooleyi TaxID=133065 RepID=UPI00217FA8DC|nr:uncharacterized protein LOC126844909 [Adelges cooleyi]
MEDSFISTDEGCSSSSKVLETQLEVLENTVVISDDFTLYDVLQKFKEQVRNMNIRVSQLDQYLNLIKNPVNPVKITQQEILKIKHNIINGITSLLKELKPLNYPGFQCLSSVKLLKVYDKLSEEFKLYLNNVKQDNENSKNQIERINSLAILLKDFKEEVDTIIEKNIINEDVENEIAKEFKECKTNMYNLLSQADSFMTIKEALSLLVECNDEDDEDAWLNTEDMPHIVLQCLKLKKNGFVVQNEKNKHLFRLNV